MFKFLKAWTDLGVLNTKHSQIIVYVVVQIFTSTRQLTLLANQMWQKLLFFTIKT